jgi:hypothetical protein
MILLRPDQHRHRLETFLVCHSVLPLSQQGTSLNNTITNQWPPKDGKLGHPLMTCRPVLVTQARAHLIRSSRSSSLRWLPLGSNRR